MSAYVALEKGSIAPYWPSLTQILCIDSPTSYRSCMFLTLEGVEPPQVRASTAVYSCSQLMNWCLRLPDSS